MCRGEDKSLFITFLFNSVDFERSPFHDFENRAGLAAKLLLGKNVTMPIRHKQLIIQYKKKFMKREKRRICLFCKGAPAMEP